MNSIYGAARNICRRRARPFQVIRQRRFVEARQGQPRIFWLKDERLKGSVNLPDSDVIAAVISPKPVALILGSGRFLGSEALNSNPREVKLSPAVLEANPPDSS
jgi:hypothetical protein